ncbi:MAG: YcnI family protein [Desertimonas sp.]
MQSTHPRSFLRRLLVATPVVGIAAAAMAAGSVSAHVSIVEQEAAAGSYSILTFGVPHGCDGSATTTVRIQMPESINAVTPTRNALYEVEKVMEALDTPIEGSHGEEITERVSEVVYTAITPLPDGYRDSFELSLQIPADAPVDEMLYFPVVQTCEVGETAWIELPGDDGAEPEHPAPGILVTAAADDGHDHDHGDEADDDHADEVTATTEAMPMDTAMDTATTAAG